MGISAHYYAYSQDDIEKIKNGDVGELLDEYDMDNLWDAMCKMLTGTNFKQRLKAGDIFSSNEPFSWAIFGRSALNEELSEMISFSSASDVKDVAETLKNVEISALLAKINLKEFASSKTYPDILGGRANLKI
ncbi:YfbM family protein [Campylobacter concisus]|uniref:YfbM family protein n=1 Tax=Campylobacter concisus TaxID=199 RepID=UPI00215627A7|nr:YfbM family protein [Campylobacter concisus]